MRVWISWAALLLLSLASISCGGAEWHKIEIDAPYQVPKSLTISVSSPPDLREAAKILALAVADELQSRAVSAVILPPASGAAEINLELYHWNTLSTELSWTRPASAQGTITVMVDTATLGLRGSVSGWKNAGGTINDAASSAGHLIGRTIATGPERRAVKH